MDGLRLDRNVNRSVYEHSKYLSHNETEASLAWDSILAGHGVVAIKPQYAAQKNLPSTATLPGSSGDLVYVIEAYHAIHCVVSLYSMHSCSMGMTYDYC